MQEAISGRPGQGHPFVTTNMAVLRCTGGAALPEKLRGGGVPEAAGTCWIAPDGEKP